MQQPDRDRPDAVPLEPRQKRVHRFLVEGNQDLAFVIHPLGDRPAQAPRHQRRRPVDGEVVLVEPVLEGHLHRIAEPFRDDERGPRTRAFDDGVGGKRRAMEDEANLAGLDPRRPRGLADRGHHALLGGPRRGQHLGGDHFAVTELKRDIREGSADVHGEAMSGFVVHCASPKASGMPRSNPVGSSAVHHKSWLTRRMPQRRWLRSGERHSARHAEECRRDRGSGRYPPQVHSHQRPNSARSLHPCIAAGRVVSGGVIRRNCRPPRLPPMLPVVRAAAA